MWVVDIVKEQMIGRKNYNKKNLFGKNEFFTIVDQNSFFFPS